MLKPELEEIALEGTERSFHFFKRQTKAFTPFWHYHPELELTFISKGNGTRFIGDSILPFSDFDLVLVGENIPHHWVSIPNSDASLQEAFVFQFKKELFAQFKECKPFLDLFKKAEHGIYFSNPEPSLVSKILNFENLSGVEQLSSLISLLQDLCENPHQTKLTSQSYTNALKRKSSELKIAEATNYILEHLDKKITVSHMANITHMVPQSFCRWFKQHSGHSFISFLNKARVELACHYLLTSNRLVQDIAFSTGFESLSHFNRTFKKIKAVSPTKLRHLYIDGAFTKTIS